MERGGGRTEHGALSGLDKPFIIITTGTLLLRKEQVHDNPPSSLGQQVVFCDSQYGSQEDR